MKKKNLLFCLLLLFLPPSSVKADTTQSILIASKQLPYLMYVKVQDEKHMQVNFIPRDMILPTPCQNKAVPLKKIDLKTSFPCVQQSVENFFNIKSKHYVYVHLNRIANDLNLPYDDIDFRKLSNLTDYFSSVVDHLHLSTILNYARYIDSDMSLSDYYDFYHMFKGKKVKISYYYVNQLFYGKYTLPMDHRFHKLK